MACTGSRRRTAIRPRDATAPPGAELVKCGSVWEVRIAGVVVSWAESLSAAHREAVRHARLVGASGDRAG
jgi:hypothetical protein